MLEPFGASWHQTALLAAMIANANRDPDVKPEPFTAEDFLPPRETGIAVTRDETPAPESEPDEPHWMQMKRLFQSLADAHKENQT